MIMTINQAVYQTFSSYHLRVYCKERELARATDEGNLDPVSFQMSSCYLRNMEQLLMRLETAVRKSLLLPAEYHDGEFTSDRDSPADLDGAVRAAFQPFYQDSKKQKDGLDELRQRGALSKSLYCALDDAADDTRMLLLAVDGTLRAYLRLPRTNYDVAYRDNPAQWP